MLRLQRRLCSRPCLRWAWRIYELFHAAVHGALYERLLRRRRVPDGFGRRLDAVHRGPNGRHQRRHSWPSRTNRHFRARRKSCLRIRAHILPGRRWKGSWGLLEAPWHDELASVDSSHTEFPAVAPAMASWLRAITTTRASTITTVAASPTTTSLHLHELQPAEGRSRDVVGSTICCSTRLWSHKRLGRFPNHKHGQLVRGCNAVQRRHQRLGRVEGHQLLLLLQRMQELQSASLLLGREVGKVAAYDAHGRSKFRSATGVVGCLERHRLPSSLPRRQAFQPGYQLMECGESARYDSDVPQCTKFQSATPLLGRLKSSGGLLVLGHVQLQSSIVRLQQEAAP